MTAPYDGIPESLIKPVFEMACSLRFDNPSTEDIINLTRTDLEQEVVSVILNGALRLVPADQSAEATVARRQKVAETAAKARMAELRFLEQMGALQAPFLTETEQMNRITAAHAAGSKDIVQTTPDVLFLQPTIVCGILCSWVEYKNTFGFRANPYMASQQEKQLRKCASTFGPGIVVFSLGFERHYLQIDGVYCFREAEVLQWLAAQH